MNLTDYHFIKTVSRRTLKTIYLFRRKHTELQELQELIKLEKILQKIYPTYYNLLIAHDLWHAHYQIL